MTNGSLKITSVDSNDEEDVYLYTYHTAMDIPKWVKNVPALLAKKKNFISNKKRAIENVRHDGTISDWFFGTSHLAAGVISSSPFCLIPMSVKQFKEYEKENELGGNDYVLTVNEKNGIWKLTSHATEEEIKDMLDFGEEYKAEETINPIELFVNCYPE